MDHKQIAKQMIKFNKTAFDNSFSAMTMVYEQNKKMMESFLNQAAWLPEGGRKAIADWMEAYHNGCGDLKKLLDENYAEVETYFDNA